MMKVSTMTHTSFLTRTPICWRNLSFQHCQLLRQPSSLTFLQFQNFCNQSNDIINSSDENNDSLKERSDFYWDDVKKIWKKGKMSNSLNMQNIEKVEELSIPESFALVQVGGRQYKVTKGDLILTEKLSFPDVGEGIRLKKVLLVGSKNFTLIGRPLLLKAAVEATVEEQTKAAKAITFKKKRRKHHQRTRTSRQNITVLRIGEIKMWYDNLDNKQVFG